MTFIRIGVHPRGGGGVLVGEFEKNPLEVPS